MNRASRRVLEIGGDNRFARGHAVNEWPSWGGACQQWQFEAASIAGYYNVRNRLSRQYMEIGPLDGITPTSIGGGDFIVSYTNTILRDGAFANQNFRDPQAREQDWTFLPVPGSLSPVSGRPYYRIQNRNSGKYLENLNAIEKSLVATSSPNSANWAWQWSSRSTAASQQYDIVDVSADQGVYEIVNARSGQVLSSDLVDLHVSQLPGWGLASQQWSFSGYNSDGYLAIMARSTGQALEIGGDGDLTQPGRTANVWNWWGGNNQQWALLDINDSHRLTIAEASDGRRCSIFNRGSYKILEIGGSANEQLAYDRRANQWYNFSGLNQQWYVRYVSLNRVAGPGASVGASQIVAAGTKSESGTPHQLVLYPNPARDELQISLAGLAGNARALVAVSVTDLRGGKVVAPYLDGRIDLTTLAPGFYIVRASDGVRDYYQKFVKE